MEGENTQFAAAPGKALTAKLSKILAQIEYVPKNGWNDFHKYKYATESDVADHVRKLLSAEKLFVYADTYKAEDMDAIRGIVRVYTRFTFSDSESGEAWTVTSIGDAQDLGSKGRGDKGIYKAITGAAKYFQMKNFMIPTGDDPERDDIEKKQAPQNNRADNRRPPASTNPPVARNNTSTTATMKTKSNLVSVISDAQVTRLHTIKTNAGWTDRNMKAYLTKLGLDQSTKNIPKDKYEDICTYVGSHTVMAK